MAPKATGIQRNLPMRAETKPQESVQKNLETLIDQIEGLPCWHVSTGGAVGPSFQLALGKKVKRKVPLSNTSQPDDYRQHEGEANLLVWCSWRLDGPSGPLTSSDDASEGAADFLRQLEGHAIVEAQSEPPAWDLRLRFANQLTLRLFCDHVGAASIDSNWELWCTNVAAIIGLASDVEIEPR
jgi:hypothetical protein